jgi:hypothetical protein
VTEVHTVAAATVTVVVALADPDAAVIDAVPFATAVTRPADDTVATAAFDVAHVTVALAIVAPFWSLTVAVSWVVAVSEAKVSWESDNSTLVATGVGVEVEVSVPELGLVVVSPPHAVNNRTVPTNPLYKRIQKTRGRKVLRTCR